MSAEPQQSPVLDGPCQTQLPVKTRRPSKKGFVKTAEYLTARFQGEGVRYKAKLIGIDTVPEAQGDKMCLDSMMKLKGREVAARNSGQHKQRIWLKVSAAGIQIIDEKSGHAAHTHPNEQISFIKKDETDPRAFAYVFAQDGTYTLLSIKTANSADPVVEDLRDVCQIAAKLNEVRCVCSIGKRLRSGTVSGRRVAVSSDWQARSRWRKSGQCFPPGRQMLKAVQDVDNTAAVAVNQAKQIVHHGSMCLLEVPGSCFDPIETQRHQSTQLSGRLNADCLLLDEEVTQVQKVIDEIDLFNPLPSSADSDTNKVSPSSELSSLFPPSSPFTLPQAQPLPGSPVSPLELYHTGTHQPVWAAQMASSFNHLSQVQPTPFGQPTAATWIQQAPFGTPTPSQLGPWGAQASPTQPAPWGGPGPASPTQPGPWGATASPTQPDPWGATASPKQPDPWGATASPTQPDPWGATASPTQLTPWGATASPTQLTPWEASGPLSQPGAVPPVPGVWAQSAPTQPGQRVPGVWGQPSSTTPFPASAPPPVPEQGFSPLSSSTETTKSVLWQTSASSSLLEKDPYAALSLLNTESSSDIW
ncbi:hypothetical protein AOXY_G24810 [Acipenser oxyrinchus oxyrinchus]|uniref:PID domain-containing protein n=1 Tax=Acipenser oxyrinchus oxyrinchus TaxID=40147 RepID=A0AAD8CUX3_ACIOX|nr:hypothetical protein AOXY_G24810 [Acipenser oxyrinchus oxyrinchus]